jgi:hypothetical protein
VSDVEARVDLLGVMAGLGAALATYVVRPRRRARAI